MNKIDRLYSQTIERYNGIKKPIFYYKDNNYKYDRIKELIKITNKLIKSILKKCNINYKIKFNYDYTRLSLDIYKNNTPVFIIIFNPPGISPFYKYLIDKQLDNIKMNYKDMVLSSLQRLFDVFLSNKQVFITKGVTYETY